MPAPLTAADRLIVALDYDRDSEALGLVDTLGDAVTFYKVGLQLFMGSGLGIVKELAERQKKVFLDLKIDDTPRTVEHAVRNMADDGVTFFTLQGNAATVSAAKRGRGERKYPKFLQVTYLSSWDADDLRELFRNPVDQDIQVDDMVVARTAGILKSGCDGVIAAGTSVSRLRQDYKTSQELMIVSPGIRPAGTATQDHKRALTPAEAIESGSDYLVVGRPIRDASDPVAMTQCIVDDMAESLRR